MPNGTDSHGIDMDVFNETVGGKTPSINPVPKGQPKVNNQQQSQQAQQTGVKNGIDMDVFNESLKKKDGGIGSPTESPLQKEDDKVNQSAPPPTVEEQAKLDLQKSQQKIQEKNNGLLNSIDVFNKAFSTNYNPMQVFGSADKTADFLQQYQTKTFQTKAQIEQERQQRLGSSEGAGQPLPTNINPINQTGNFIVNSSKNIDYLKSHVVNKTIEEDKTAGVTKAETINKIFKRVDPKNYKILQDAGQLKNEYEIDDPVAGTVKLSMNNDLLLSSKGQAELLYNKGLVDIANNNITTGTINKDPKLIKEGQNYLSEVKSEDEILKNYPALQKQKIAYNVSREIAKESGQLDATTAEDGQTGTKLIGAGDQQIKDAMTKLGYLNDPNTKDIALSMLNQKELFSDASYLGGFGNALLRPFKELGMSVGDITHLRTDKDIEASIKKDQMFPEETEGLKGYVGKIRTAVNTTGNLIGMAAIAAGTEGVGAEAGLGLKAAKHLAAYTSFGLPAYDAALKESHDFLDSDGARTSYAIISSVINAEGGRLLDLGKLSNLPGVKDDVLKLAKNLTEQNISDDVAKESINNLSKKIVNVASKYGKNITKGAAVMTGFNVASNLQKIAFGDKSIKMEDVLPQAGKAFVDGVLGMSVLGGFGAAEDMREEKNTTYKGFIYKMALNHDSTADIFKMAKDKGEYTDQEYNQKMKFLNTATVAKRALDAAQDETNVELNEKQKSVYVANKTAMAVLNDRIESLPKEDEGEKNKLQSQVDRLDKQNKEIFKGLDFNSVLEPLHDLKSAEQDYDNAIEEINKTGKEPANFDKIKEKFQSLQKQYSEQNKRNSDEYNEINKGENTEGEEAKNEKTKGSDTESKKEPTVDFTGKDNNFLANKEPDFFSDKERENYNDLMKDTNTQDQAGKMVSDRKEELYSQTKTEQDEKNSSKKGGEENAPEKESGSEENGKGNAPEINVVPKEGSAEPVSEVGSSTTNDKLKDVESTSKALGTVSKDNPDVLNNIKAQSFNLKNIAHNADKVNAVTNKITSELDNVSKEIPFKYNIEHSGNNNSTYITISDKDSDSKYLIRVSDHEKTSPTRRGHFEMPSADWNINVTNAKDLDLSISGILNKIKSHETDYPSSFISKERLEEKGLDENQLHSNIDNRINQSISEEYHKAKETGSNSKLVKSVEEAIGKTEEKSENLFNEKGATESGKAAFKNALEKAQPKSQQEINAIRKEVFGDEAFYNDKVSQSVKGISDAYMSKGGEPTDNKEVNDKEKPNEAVNALQGSYDRLLKGGESADDPEMKKLQSKIEDLKKETPTDNEPPKPPKSEGMPNVSSKEAETIGMANTIINNKRIEEGIHELVSEGSRSFKQAWSDLMDRITGVEKFKPREFIQSKYDQFKNENKKIAFTDDDEVAWYFDAVDLANDKKRYENEYKEAVDRKADSAELIGISDNLQGINTKIQQSQELARHVGTIGARTLAFRRNLVNLNKEIVAWSSSFRTEYGNMMPESMYKQVEGMEKEFKATNEELSKRYDEIYNKAFEGAYQKAKTDFSKIKPTKDVIAREKTLKEKGAAAADKILKLQIKQDKNTLQSNPFQIPLEAYNLLIKTIAESVRLGATVADAIDTALKNTDFKNVKKDDIINHLTGGFSYAEKVDNSLSEIKDIKKSNGDKQLSPEMVKPLKRLINTHIQNNPDAKSSDIIKMSTNDLKSIFPDISEKEIRDTYSGLGVKEETKEKIQSNLSKFNGMIKEVNDFHDLSKPKTDETPKEQFNRQSKLRRQFDKIKPYLDELGIQVEPPTGYDNEQKSRAYNEGKSIANSLVEDADKEKSRLEDIKKKSGNLDNDERIEILSKEHSKLSNAIDEINKSKGSDEEKLKNTRNLIKNQIDNYKSQKNRYNSDNILRPKDSNEYTKTRKVITALNERITDLNSRLKDFDTQADPYVTPEEKAIAKLNHSLHESAERWQSKLDRRDFDEKQTPKSEKALEKGNTPAELLYGRDKKTIELELKAKRLENDYYAIKHAAEISKNGTFRKVVSMLAAVKRGFVLSRLSTFVKLTGAATENIVSAPIETAVGYVNYGLSKAHIISPKLIDKAQRYGVPILGGEVDALKMFGNKKTWQDFKKNIQGKPDDLSLLYSGGSDYDFIGNIPKEYRDAWMQMEHGFEAPSRGHGAIKGLAKHSEYDRSFVTRMDNVKRLYGEDKANDPLMHQLVGSLAYADAKRSILMENNLMTDAYQKQIKSLQKGGVGANLFGLTLQELMPVVKVPTNMALMVGRATLGFPLAGGEIAFRSVVEMVNGNSKLGISQLSPERADALLRNLRKGQVGMALMLAGYFNPNMFGASPVKTKGTEEQSGLEEGEVKLFGLEVPKLFVDNPYLMTMRVGSTLGQLYQNYRYDDYNVVASSMCAAAKTGYTYATNELPLLSTPTNAVKSGEALITGKDYMNWWLYGQVKASIEPGALQNIAEIQDSDNWWSGVIGKGNKRKPSGFVETLETGIPDMGFNSGFNRQNVDLK